MGWDYKRLRAPPINSHSRRKTMTADVPENLALLVEVEFVEFRCLGDADIQKHFLRG